MSQTKSYLYDGVYAEDDGLHIILTTEGNRIALDTRALSELLLYIEHRRYIKITVTPVEELKKKGEA